MFTNHCSPCHSPCTPFPTNINTFCSPRTPLNPKQSNPCTNRPFKDSFNCQYCPYICIPQQCTPHHTKSCESLPIPNHSRYFCNDRIINHCFDNECSPKDVYIQPRTCSMQREGYYYPLKNGEYNQNTEKPQQKKYLQKKVPKNKQQIHNLNKDFDESGDIAPPVLISDISSITSDYDGKLEVVSINIRISESVISESDLEEIESVTPTPVVLDGDSLNKQSAGEKKEGKDSKGNKNLQKPGRKQTKKEIIKSDKSDKRDKRLNKNPNIRKNIIKDRNRVTNLKKNKEKETLRGTSTGGFGGQRFQTDKSIGHRFPDDVSTNEKRKYPGKLTMRPGMVECLLVPRLLMSNNDLVGCSADLCNKLNLNDAHSLRYGSKVNQKCYENRCLELNFDSCFSDRIPKKIGFDDLRGMSNYGQCRSLNILSNKCQDLTQRHCPRLSPDLRSEPCQYYNAGQCHSLLNHLPNSLTASTYCCSVTPNHCAFQQELSPPLSFNCH